MSTPPLSRILVPLDGSALAEEALWVAAHLARRLDAALHIVTVRVAPNEAGQTTARPGTIREIRHDLREYLAEKADELATTHGVSCSCGVLHGRPSEALAEHVRANGIALVVMTAHGRSGVSRRWIGSVTEAVVARLPVPVLVLRPRIAPPCARFYRILVALDGSAGARKVLSQAVALGVAEPGTEFTLVEIVEPPVPAPRHSRILLGPDPAASLVRRREAAARDLERRAERLRKHGLVVATRVLVATGVGERLIELATRLDCHLIAVGTQRPRANERLQLGSVADKVVRGASQPVLVVPVQPQSVRERLTRVVVRSTRRRAARGKNETALVGST